MVSLQQLHKQMIRFIGLLLIVTAVALVVSPPVAHAQTTGPDDGLRGSNLTPRPAFPPSNFNPITDLSPAELNDPSIPSFTQAELDAINAGGAAPGAGGAAAAGGGVGSGANTVPDQPIITIGDGFLNGLYGFVIIFFGKLVVYGAGLFSFGINNFTIGFGNLYLEWGIGFAVEQTWTTVRDLFNLTFIFGLIYIGFRMILFADDSQAKKTLVTLVGAALLVNFSLFITKFIVDVANSLTGVIFFQGFDTIKADIGVAFLNLIGLSSVFNNGDQIIDISNAGTGAGLALIFGTMLFMATAAFVFAAGGILLIIRAIALTFFMIFSPVMFLGWVFPGLAQYSKQYWKSFLGNVFMAPAYIFCIYISFRILDGFKRPISPDSNIGAAITNESSSIVIASIVFFSLAIILLVASMKVAKSMGAWGAGAALSIGDSTRKYTQGVVYRNTVGRAAKGALNTLDRAAYDDGKNGQRNWAHRNLNRTIQAGARAAGKYTPARTSLEGAYAYGAGGTGLKATRDSYDAFDLSQGSRDAQARFNKVLSDGLNAPAGAAGNAARQAMVSAVTNMSADQYSKLSPDQQKQFAKHLTSSQTENILKSEKIPEGTKTAIISARKEAIETALGDTTNMDTFADEVQKLSVDQLETMGDGFIEAHADKLTEPQMDDLKKSKKFTESQKAGFIATRGDNFEKIYNAPSSPEKSAAIKRIFVKADGKHRKAKEVARLGPNVLLKKAAVPHMTADVLDAILQEKTLGKNDRATLKNTIISSSAGNKQELLDYFKTPEAIAKW